RMTPASMDENPLWLVVLCDMMTILMLFFLVMFVLSQQGPEAQAKMLQAFDAKGVVAEAADPGMAQVVREFREEEAGDMILALFKQQGLEDSIEITETRDTIRVRLLNKLLFKTARAKINPSAAGPIRLLAGVLRQLPNEIIIEGHTDNVRITKSPFKSNWELSVARSYSVIESLLKEKIAPSRLVAAGYGEYHPLAPNDTPAGRARNRRVEIVIVRKRGGGS
ncbi:MAG: flagellar motor protein MotB, partial [Elusimicrobiota bacterium]